MKKQTYLPDFSNLCPPEQNSIQDLISLYVFFFFAASVGGYVWEVGIFLVKEGTFTNRGFLYGPWLPVYGVGAVLFYLLLAPHPLSLDGGVSQTAASDPTFRAFRLSDPDFDASRAFDHTGVSGAKRSRPAAIFLLSALIGSGVELAVGWLLDTVWQLRYWDYTGYFGNFRGYVCAASALGFGIAGTLWICVVSVFLKKMWFSLSAGLRNDANTVLFFLFLADCAAALIVPNIGLGITF